MAKNECSLTLFSHRVGRNKKYRLKIKHWCDRFKFRKNLKNCKVVSCTPVATLLQLTFLSKHTRNLEIN